MMKKTLVFLLGLILAFGCARVRVEVPKEPVKIDISMRLDIYQHVQKDIDDIESIVSGSKEKAKPKDNHSLRNFFIGSAYAQEGLSPEVEEAALRRKDRREELSSWEAKGVVGENKLGLVELKDSGAGAPDIAQLIKTENSDRMVIYQSVAKKNNSAVEDIQKLYAKRLQQDAPAGTPIEVLNEASGSYEWKIK